jgi:predicted transcriptional regulator
MAFRVRQNISHAKSIKTLTNDEKMANEIQNETITLKNNGDRYIYYPTKLPEMNYKIEKAEDYCQNFKDKLIKKPEFIKEEIIYDKNTNKWVLVKNTDIDKYK